MSHERLIVDLASSLTPVRRLPSPHVRAMRWVLLGIAAVIAGVAVRGLRENWAAAVADPAFVVTTILVAATGITAAVVTLALAVPGAVQSVWVRWVPVGLAAAWATTLVVDAVIDAGVVGSAGWGQSCMWKTWGIGVGPGAVLIVMARRAAPLDWRWTGAMAALAALAFGVLGTDLICPMTSHAHILTWHFLPVALTSLAVFGATALWTRRRG